MPRKGYDTVTLKSEVIGDIDSMINVDDEEFKTRSKVVTHAVKKLLEARA